MEIKEQGLGEQKVNWSSGDDVPTREQVLEGIANQENPQPPPEPIKEVVKPTEQAAQPIQPVQPEGQAKGTEVSPEVVAPPIQGQQPTTETKPTLTDEQVKDFLDKKHVPQQDAWKLVEMYKNAEKKISQTSQELASLKKNVPIAQPAMQPAVQPEQSNVSQISGLPYTSTDPNAQMLEDLQANPIATMQKVAELSYGKQVGQLTESLNDQKLHNAVVRLSTSPDTAEFNLPAVQEEIKAIMAERPDLSNNISDNLPMLNDLAIGRLYRAGKLNKDAVEAGKKIAEQNLATRQATTMEGPNRPEFVGEKPFEGMNTEEQGAYLRKQIAGI